MLSSQVLEIIDSTVPVLIQHGEALTRHFYRRMFDGNPEVASLFNPSHQVDGRQQRALAGAVLAYAQHIRQPELLSDAVERIAQKHASLGVLAEHYPVVGEHLLASIGELLELPEDDPILDAWGQAYGVLAGIFINREESLYQAQERATGRRGFRSFHVARRVQESDNVLSIHLLPADEGPVPSYKAGQYTTVRVKSKDGQSTTMRNYSLSQASGSGSIRISVKREMGQGHAPDGYVSNLIHQEWKSGDRIELGHPCGSFTLRPAPASRPLVLISGGVGITPLLAMAQESLRNQPERAVLFVHATQHGGAHAFRAELEELRAEHPALRLFTCYEHARPESDDSQHCNAVGRIDEERLTTLLGDMDVDVYYCGPKGFMQSMRQALSNLGVELDRQFYECFGPLE